MKIYIVEDEVFQLEDMLITIETLGYEVVGNSDDPFEAQEQIEALMPDLVLMDIHLNGKKAGVNLAKRIYKAHSIPIIFTTSETDSKTITEVAEVNPITYLTKPINENDLRAALLIAKTRNEINTKSEVKIESNELFVKNGNKLIKVLINSILFVHTDTKNYCTIVTEDGKKLSVRSSILGLQKLLNSNTFVQTHRSYIINWSKLDFFYEADQTIDIQGHSIPVGRTFKQELHKKLNII